MLEFDSANPFPLIDSSPATYEREQMHALEVDAWLGLRTSEIEQALRLTQQTKKLEAQLWLHRSVSVTQTPYTEIRVLLERLEPERAQTIVDLGAGYGRMGFVVGCNYPEINYVGYEIAVERVEESRRCAQPFSFQRVRFEQADLSDPAIAPVAADFYFLYDFGTRRAIEKTLDDLKKIASTKAITVVGRGRASRDAIEHRHPWLAAVVAPQHHPHYSIYYSRE